MACSCQRTLGPASRYQGGGGHGGGQVSFDMCPLSPSLPAGSLGQGVNTTALSTEAYVREHKSSMRPLFSLKPSGADLSTIMRHLLEWGFGTRPTGITCT